MDNSLFGDLVLKDALREMKRGLISRYYPFTKEELKVYGKELNWEAELLMSNEAFQWDTNTLVYLEEFIDFSLIYKRKELFLETEDVIHFADKFDFNDITFYMQIKWTQEFFDEFIDCIDWSQGIVYRNEVVSKRANLLKIRGKVNWKKASANLLLTEGEELLNEFKDFWDWENLSSNPTLKLTVEFLQSHKEQLDFDRLSRNPASWALIQQYPGSKRWNWNLVVANPAISWNENTWRFVLQQYKAKFTKERPDIPAPLSASIAERSLLSQIIVRSHVNRSFFLSDQFKDNLPWELLDGCYTLSEVEPFLIQNLDRINLKKASNVKICAPLLDEKLVNKYWPSLINSGYGQQYLPLTIKLINQLKEGVNWNWISSNEKIDWTYDFIYENSDQLNFWRLAKNRAVYDRLVLPEITQIGIASYIQRLPTF